MTKLVCDNCESTSKVRVGRPFFDHDGEFVHAWYHLDGLLRTTSVMRVGAGVTNFRMVEVTICATAEHLCEDCLNLAREACREELSR